MRAREILEFEAKNKAWSHAYLFVGGNIDSRSEIVDFIARENQCKNEDLIDIQPEEGSGKKGEIKVDAMREMLHRITLLSESTRLVVINSAEKLNQSSGNILLRSLEEPKSKAIFILFSDFDSVLPTIKSRCRLYHLNKSGREPFEAKYLSKIRLGFPEASSEIERVVKNEETTQYLAEMENFFLTKMENRPDPELANALAEIIQARREISGNANPRLALESLYIKTREGLK